MRLFRIYILPRSGEPMTDEAQTSGTDEAGTGGADDAGAAELADLKAKVSEFRDNNVKLMKQLKTFEGIDPDEYRSMTERLQELEHKAKADKAGITADQLKKLRADITEDLETRKYGKVMSDNESLRAEVRSLRLDSKIKATMAEQGVRSERIDALFRLNADAFDLTDDGEPILKERPGADIGKYIADDLRQAYPEFYNGSGASGGGAAKSTSAGGGYTRQVAANDKAAMTANLEKIASGEVEVVMP